MFKKPTKRQYLIRRIILSSIATLAVLVIATVAILSMLGFRLDSNNGRLEQGALLQFDSRPNGADVYVDGHFIGSRTATKQTVVAGTHTVKMTKAGYRDWSRTLTLTAGTLTWLDYIRFVPKELPVQTVTNYPTLARLSISPDGRWALAHETADSATFRLADLRAEEVKTSDLVLPATSYSESQTPDVIHSFNIISWDEDGRYVLVKHLYRDQTEWLVVDTQNSAATVNVTQLLSVNFKDLQFASTNGKSFYGLTNDGAIRKLDVSAATLSRAFVTHVDSFSMYDNSIISYVGVDPADATSRVAGVYRDGDEVPHILRATTSSDIPLNIVSSRYFSDMYVAVAEGNVVTVLKGSYPSSIGHDTSSLTKIASLELSGTVSGLSFSPKGGYVVAQSGETFKSYEIEHNRIDVGGIAVAKGQAASSLKWLDVAHLWNDDNGRLTMRDFNGINIFTIMNVEPGFDASLSQNGRFFYAVGKNENGYHLQRVKMILD